MQFGEETTPIRKGIISKSGGCDEEIVVWAGDGLCFAGGVRSRAGQGTVLHGFLRSENEPRSARPQRTKAANAKKKQDLSELRVLCVKK